MKLRRTLLALAALSRLDGSDGRRHRRYLPAHWLRPTLADGGVFSSLSPAPRGSRAGGGGGELAGAVHALRSDVGTPPRPVRIAAETKPPRPKRCSL